MSESLGQLGSMLAQEEAVQRELKDKFQVSQQKAFEIQTKINNIVKNISQEDAETN